MNYMPLSSPALVHSHHLYHHYHSPGPGSVGHFEHSHLHQNGGVPSPFQFPPNSNMTPPLTVGTDFNQQNTKRANSACKSATTESVVTSIASTTNSTATGGGTRTSSSSARNSYIDDLSLVPFLDPTALHHRFTSTFPIQHHHRQLATHSNHHSHPFAFSKVSGQYGITGGLCKQEACWSIICAFKYINNALFCKRVDNINKREIFTLWFFETLVRDFEEAEKSWQQFETWIFLKFMF